MKEISRRYWKCCCKRCMSVCVERERGKWVKANAEEGKEKWVNAEEGKEKLL